MRFGVGVLCTCIVACICTVTANVEKTIFIAPLPLDIPLERELLNNIPLPTLSPSSPVLETRLPVQFPTKAAPRGLQYWYRLQGLEQGRRYEVRVCWPATSPTDFYLETFLPTEILESPQLQSSVAEYGEERGGDPFEYSKEPVDKDPLSALFLRIEAAASFYSTDQKLMEYPPEVDIDIILDPYILNILPRSLVPTAIYVSFAAVGAWFLSGFIYNWLLSVAAEPKSKPHSD